MYVPLITRDHLNKAAVTDYCRELNEDNLGVVPE